MILCVIMCMNLGKIAKAERVCDLKKEVSKMIYKEESLKDKLEFVDALQQLGVAYHFKEEINYVLTNIFKSKIQEINYGNDDLYLVSLLFRLLRTNGFSVPEDMFRNFFDENGDCKPKISLNINGMLSLYEASYFAKEGEEMLEMARHYTTKHLTKYLESCENNEPRMKEHISHALDLPLNWRMERLHTRWFIDQYKIGEQIRHALWELAVLDFNLNQNLYKEELKQVSRWWTCLRLHENLPFIRDRLVENYLSCVGGAFEPEHYNYRIAQTQVNCLLTQVNCLLSSLNELEAFTKAIEQ
ncbi:Terpene synthase [Rhynchospora pubera]|uniref:Terpene synthase n=1 Tax=Rhynchospora pubera TaxID=906938 RepID=A0AAV8D877_9POAL|nr:Terpene synthase [Rhynchospora pubera]